MKNLFILGAMLIVLQSCKSLNIVMGDDPAKHPRPAIAVTDTVAKKTTSRFPRTQLVYTGKLDVYMETSIQTDITYGPNGSRTRSSYKSYSYFVAQPLSRDMVYLEYKNIKNLIPKADPAYSYIKKYRRQQSVQRITGWTGAGLALSGFIVSAIAEKKGNRTVEVAGYGALSAGLVATVVSLSTLTHRKERTIRMAVGKYNGVDYDELEAKKKAEKKPVDF